MKPLVIWLVFLLIMISCILYMAYHVPSMRAVIISSLLFLPLFTVAKAISNAIAYKINHPQEKPYVQYKEPKKAKSTIKAVFQSSKTSRILK